MKPLTVTTNREIEGRGGGRDREITIQRTMTEAVESQMGASLTLEPRPVARVALVAPLPVEGMDTTASMHNGGLSPVPGEMKPLLDRLEPLLLSTDRTESGNIAWNMVYHLVSKGLLPPCTEGMCGLKDRAIRGLGLIDFLYMQYKIGAIGKVWLDQGEIPKAFAATPWVAIDPRAAYPGTLQWIKDFGKCGSRRKPIGPVFCDLCLSSSHPGHTCNEPFHLIRGEMPRTDISQWKALYKRHGMVLGGTPPTASPTPPTASPSLLEAVREGQRKFQGPSGGAGGPQPPTKKQMVKKE